MSALAALEGRRAHERTITIRNTAVEGGLVLVTGELVDLRTVDNYLMTGERVPAGELHHIVVRFLVDPDSMRIVDAESEMVKVPRPACMELENSAGAVKGLSVTKGFTKRVKDLLGGTKGCTHLVTLILAMAPAALQGVWAWRAHRKPDPGAPGDRARLEAASNVLVDSCYVWRRGGPLHEKLVRTVELLAGQGDKGTGGESP